MQRRRRSGRQVRSAVAARLGFDGNPLRRRTDTFASWVAVALFAAFLAGAPLAAIAAGRWADRAVLAERWHQRTWHQVTATLLQTGQSQAAGFDSIGGDSWSKARWKTPSGREHEGIVPVIAGERGRIRIWVDASGTWTGPPLSRGWGEVRVAVVAATAPVVLGVVLLAAAAFVQHVLDWRRLAAWEKAWTSVGPQWTRKP